MSYQSNQSPRSLPTPIYLPLQLLWPLLVGGELTFPTIPPHFSSLIVGLQSSYHNVYACLSPPVTRTSVMALLQSSLTLSSRWHYAAGGQWSVPGHLYFK